jgi:Beta-propeller repeat
LVLDGSGNIWVTGKTTGSLGGTQLGIHSTTDDMVLAEFGTTGTLSFVTQVGSELPCQGGEQCNGFISAVTAGTGITIDGSGNFYVVGYASGLIPGATQYRSHGANPGNSAIFDATLTKFNSSGALVSSSQIGVTDSTTEGLAVTLSTVGTRQAYIVGYSNGNLGGSQLGAIGTDSLMIVSDTSAGVMP